MDLGVTSQGASRIAFGLISLSDFMLDLELSALQADGYGEVISTPKVLTADKQKRLWHLVPKFLISLQKGWC